MFIDFSRAQNTTIILALFCSQMMFACVNFRILRALFFFFFFPFLFIEVIREGC